MQSFRVRRWLLQVALRAGVDAGGKDRSAPRGVFVLLWGTDLAKESLGERGDARDIPDPAGALCFLSTSSFRHLPHPQPNPSTVPKAPSLLHPQPFTPKLHYPAKVPRLGWGKKEGGGESEPWARYLLESGCLLWNVSGFSFALEIASPHVPPFSPISPTSRLSSFSILVRYRGKISAVLSLREPML